MVRLTGRLIRPAPVRSGSVGAVTIQIAPSTPMLWDDVVSAFGRRGADPSWCWCRRFLDSSEAVDNRTALQLEVSTASIPPGLIAYVDGLPAGWTRVMPRHQLPGVLANRALRRVLADDDGAWWVTCFAVQQRFRSIGVARALLDAAVAHARLHGATAIEGHPVDTHALKAERTSGSALFTGTMRLFAAAGFREIGRTYPSRPVMRLDL
jgi:GNAT superfamily N-acetyltransferase